MKTEIGNRYGRLTVVSLAIGKGSKKWVVICDCGTAKTVAQQHLQNGRTRSCGCLLSESTSARATKHGKHGSKIYKVWDGMAGRCTRPSHNSYQNYGGRGISVCEEWRTFASFYHDMGDIPFDGAQIDRIDNSLGYFKANCRWVTRVENLSNTRCNTYLVHNGERLTIAAWSRRTGLSGGCIWGRIHRGWDSEDTLTRKPRITSRTGR